MTSDLWTVFFMSSMQPVLEGVMSIVPAIIIAIILLIVGWLVGAGLSKIVSQIFKAIKVDKALSATGFEQLVNRAGMKLDSGHFVGEVVKWFVIVVFLMTSFDILGLTEVNLWLKEYVVNYIPQVLVAVLIMLTAAVIGDALGKTVVASAKAGKVHSANFLGTLTRWSIWIFAAMIALSHLGVGGIFLQTLFTGVVVALALAFGLAFGLGGKEAAADAIAKIKKEISNRE